MSGHLLSPGTCLGWVEVCWEWSVEQTVDVGNVSSSFLLGAPTPVRVTTGPLHHQLYDYCFLPVCTVFYGGFPYYYGYFRVLNTSQWSGETLSLTSVVIQNCIIVINHKVYLRGSSLQIYEPYDTKFLHLFFYGWRKISNCNFILKPLISRSTLERISQSETMINIP